MPASPHPDPQHWSNQPNPTPGYQQRDDPPPGVDLDTWRDLTDKKGKRHQDAPASSHLKGFDLHLFTLGRHTITVTFRAKVGAKGQQYPESSYVYGWSDVESCLSVWNAMCATEDPGEILHAWVIKAGIKGTRKK